jgi:D-tyrosyl-tRNA(Tyr) deacylase|tara:strand:- start:651 stop:1088 length:438 start_codon:yes stop_codon:yes gene_type:complete
LKLLVQRVSRASVEVQTEEIASIKKGVLVFVGFDKEDNYQILESLTNKLLNYKIFNDSKGKVSMSLIETNHDILVVPQVTLSIGTKKGIKPSFSNAADPAAGKKWFDDFQKLIEEKFKKPASGDFGAEMSVSLVNEGPITFWFEL